MCFNVKMTYTSSKNAVLLKRGMIKVYWYLCHWVTTQDKVYSRSHSHMLSFHLQQVLEVW